MATKTYDTDVSVAGKVTQTGTPSSGGDLTTKTYVDAEVAAKQTASADLTDLIARWVAASAAGPASLDFAEDTDNGTNKITLIGQSTLGGDFVITMPGVTGTVLVTGGTDVAVADGGTGRSTSTTAYGVLAAGTTATGAHQTISPGTSGHVLVSGGASALASFVALIFGTHVTGTIAQLNTAVTDADVATIAGTETLTGKTMSGTNNTFSAIAGSSLADDGVTNAKLADMAANSIKGNNTGSSANPIDMSVAQTKTLLALSNVDNTSDANKPVSTAQATADDLRVAKATFPVHYVVALSDESTVITTGVGKITLHTPFAFTVTQVYAEVNTVSSSGVVTVDINEGAGSGTTILSTKLTIDASEETSGTAATAAVISDTAIAANGRLTFDVDTAGTGAKGLKVHILGTRAI